MRRVGTGPFARVKAEVEMQRFLVLVATALFLAACAPESEPQSSEPTLPDPAESYQAGVTASATVAALSST